MARQRRSFTSEFKIEAVKLVTEKGYSVAEAARSLLKLMESCMIRFALWSLTLTLSSPLFAKQPSAEPEPAPCGWGSGCGCVRGCGRGCCACAFEESNQLHMPHASRCRTRLDVREARLAAHAREALLAQWAHLRGRWQ